MLKECCICKQSKPLDHFYKNNHSKDGCTYQCKQCLREKYRGYYKERYADDAEFRAKENARNRKINKQYHKSGRRKAKRELSIRHFLSAKMGNIRKTVKKYNHDFNINLDYLCELWDKQDGKCALTKVPMTHKYHCPYSVSPDRKDSEKGYIKGNIQLVCKAINLAKNDLPDGVILEWIEAIKTR